MARGPSVKGENLTARTRKGASEELGSAPGETLERYDAGAPVTKAPSRHIQTAPRPPANPHSSSAPGQSVTRGEMSRAVSAPISCGTLVYGAQLPASPSHTRASPAGS